jgi:hypothetical protein
MEEAERNTSLSLQWEIPYVLKLWLSLLTLTPYDLNKIDSRPEAKEVFSGYVQCK